MALRSETRGKPRTDSPLPTSVTEERTQWLAYLKVVCLLVVEVVVVVREGGPPDQGGDLWTGKEFERGPQKGAFDSHLHPQGHGQQLLASPALLGLPNHSALLLIFQPHFPRGHSARSPALPGPQPCPVRPAEPGEPEPAGQSKGG